MGNKIICSNGEEKNIECTLSGEELDHFSRVLCKGIFSVEEIKALWFHFTTISSFSGTITQK
jgi:hypothetical protein